ncbi:MAG: hypothetical protein FWG68_03775 [Defluviitaleaceae bacterium]|nr:hypothetical protein [Defluviitaleaceae bacterium]
MAKVFVGKNNKFLAPDDYIEGDSALVFLVLFFYHLVHGADFGLAYEKAAAVDSETGGFVNFA